MADFTPDPQQLLAAYPDCRLAVAYCELILDTAPVEVEDTDGLTCFDLMRQARPPMTLDEILHCFRAAMRDETACKAQEALAQTYSPSFLTYLRGKMGLL